MLEDRFMIEAHLSEENLCKAGTKMDEDGGDLSNNDREFNGGKFKVLYLDPKTCKHSQ